MYQKFSKVKKNFKYCFPTVIGTNVDRAKHYVFVFGPQVKMVSVLWSIVLVCFQEMAIEVSGAKILILHPLYAGSHDLVLR